MNELLSRHILAATMLILLSPSAAMAMEDVAKLSGTSWELLQLGPNGALAENLPTLSFGEGGKVSGSGGCNTFTGTVTVSGMVIKFGPMTATKKSCSAQVNQQEAAFLKALEQAQTFQLGAQRLDITTKLFAEPLSLVHPGSVRH